MASISRLRTVLLSNLNAPNYQDVHQQFFQTLMSHRGDLVNLYDVGPRNQQERREVESGEHWGALLAISCL
jgi:nuclear pore complex protein Nup205